MHYTRLWAAAAIIGVIIVAGFALSVPHTRDITQESQKDTPATTTPQVTLSDAYKAGTHTLSGSVTAPDACASATATTTTETVGSSTAITLRLSVPETTGVCLKLPTQVPFSVKVSAEKDARVLVLVNGDVASTTAP